VSGGGRCYAKLEGRAAALEAGETDELIGRAVTLTHDEGINRARMG
jgi:hypothetical protein